MKLAIQPLFSGSSGNSILVESESTTVLVDAGMSAAAITKALKLHGKTPTDIDGILLTHEHTDHVSGVNQLCKRYGLALYANAKTYQGMEAKMHDVPIGQARVFTTGEDFYVGNIAVHAFPIPHDAAEPVGYALYAAGAKVCVATDMGHLPKRVLTELEGAGAIVLESNHDIGLLQAGKYPQFLKKKDPIQQGTSFQRCGRAGSRSTGQAGNKADHSGAPVCGKQPGKHGQAGRLRAALGPGSSAWARCVCACSQKGRRLCQDRVGVKERSRCAFAFYA